MADLALEALVTCPACQGAKMRSVQFGRKEHEQKCLPCRGIGQVEAWRVCPGCGQFVDFGGCKLKGTTMRVGSVHDKRNHNHKVIIYAGSGQIYFCCFHERDLVLLEPCMEELRQTDLDDQAAVAAIRVRYEGLKRTRPGSHPKMHRLPVAETPTAAADESPDDVYSLLRRALAADAETSKAYHIYLSAKQVSDRAWRCYETRLAALRSDGQSADEETERINDV